MIGNCGVIFLISTATISATFTNYADVTCGDFGDNARRRREGKIVGGVDALEGEFPWLVSLSRSGGHFCGGTIVNKRWILTAAHCLCSGTDTLGTAGLRVSLGRHDLRVSSSLDIPVAKIVFHPQFRCASYDSDIALLGLNIVVPWAPLVRPACFPSPGALTLPDVTVAGWGWTNENSSKGVRANVLQKVSLSVIDNPQCGDWYKSKGKKFKIRDSQLCAGLEQGGKDACWADSGGPLMTQKLDNEKTTVVGIVSTGVGCARSRLPGLYTRVAYYLDWIAATVNEA